MSLRQRLRYWWAHLEEVAAALDGDPVEQVSARLDRLEARVEALAATPARSSHERPPSP